MRKHMIGFLLMALMVPICSLGHAEEIGRHDPQRTHLISAVKRHPHFASNLAGTRLHIQRMWASDQYAFVCFYPMNSRSGYRMTDGWYDNYQVILNWTPHGWMPIAEVGPTLVESPSERYCQSGRRGALTDRFLRRAAKRGRVITAYRH
ncbi:Hypothetical protein HDN1F_33780 [gamma proteobacterium HdN1]|nr:Hypothetical protein HDN1F_33780 [gamma proteobacterium HdN1]